MLLKRKGNMVLVILIASMCAFLNASQLQLASTLYTSTVDSAKTYADIQTYRAASEMSCYSFVKELLSLSAQRDLDSGWISSGGNAFYTEVLDEMVDSLCGSEFGVWQVDNLADALSGSSLSDQAVLTELLGKFVGVQQEFRLELVSEMDIDWFSELNAQGSDTAFLALKPLEIEVYSKVKSEEIFETFFVSGLFIDVSVFEMGPNSIAQFRITEYGDEGVSITREAF